MKKKNINVFKNIFNFIYIIVKFSFLNLYRILKFTFFELYFLIKYFSIGLFKVFDFVITKFISMLSYIGYGVIIVFKNVGKFLFFLCKITYRYFLRFICIEIYLLFMAISKGFVLSVKIILYQFPIYLINKFADFLEYLANKFKSTIDRITTYIKEIPLNIKY